MSALRIGLVAGEASGDLLAGSALRKLSAHLDPAPRLAGIAGPEMKAAGVDAWWDSELLAVNGYAAVLKVLPTLLRVRRQLIQRMFDWPADLFIGIDAPDFNFGVEKRLRASGVKTMHLVSPSIWAWRRERIAMIREAVDHMLLVFPFEKKIYDEAGIPSTYVGHPLADRIPMHPDRASARTTLGLPQQGTVIAVLPGSRRSEVQHIGPVFLDAVELLRRRYPDWHFVIPAAGNERFLQLQSMLHARLRRDSASKDADWGIRLVHGQSHLALEACDATLIASGTATLEAALYKRPMVIGYRMPWLSYRMMKDRGYLPWVGLPNILANESLVPELLQYDATPERLATSLEAQLDDLAGRERLVERFTEMHASLAQGCAERVAGAVSRVLAVPRRLGR